MLHPTNPNLKTAFIDVVENQLATNDPPETRRTLERLVSEGTSEEDAKTLIAQAVCVEVFEILRHGTEFNQERYFKNLAALPQEPET